MLNRPTQTWNIASETSSGWSHDAAPRGRLVLLWIVFCVPLLGVGLRLAQLQLALQHEFTASFDQTTSTEEPIPSRNGRLLSADGQVLAEDLEQFDLQVHYRWLEEPPNPAWLKQQALKRLPKANRRNAELLNAELALVTTRRAAAWQQLGLLIGKSEPELTQLRSAIQQRVERVAHDVEARRAERSTTQIPPLQLNSWWQRVWHELTAPPQRTQADPIILAEQQAYHLLLEDIPAAAAAEILAHPLRYQCLQIGVRTRRHYPQHKSAAHLLGHRTSLRPEEATTPATASGNTWGYRVGEAIGRSGLEQTYDGVLHGVAGLRRLTRNRQGEIIASEVLREPQPGSDVLLTIDAGLQQDSEALLDAALQRITNPATPDDQAGETSADAFTPQGAALVAIDVQTGAILVAAAAPRFDANLLVSAQQEAYAMVAKDPRQPFFPRATHMALPPGSVFKVVSAIALTECGAIDPTAHFECRGYLDHPHQHRCLTFRHFGVGHGDVQLAQAMCRSCNVYFFSAARRSGAGPLVDWSRRLGLGQPTGVDVPGEPAGILPAPAESSSTTTDLTAEQQTAGQRVTPKWYPGTTLGMVIGQASLRVTPLQMARVMAVVANNGNLVTPHFVNRLGSVGELAPSSPEGHHPRHSVSESGIPLRGLHPETLAAVREGLELAISDPQGTGYKTVRHPEVSIAGKTGTAEVGGGRPDHAWFAGYVPADQPRVAFVVVLEHGGSGGKAAGPVAKAFVQKLIERQRITPTAPRTLAQQQTIDKP